MLIKYHNMTGQRRTVLITGASGGIGWELAGVCAREGHDLVLVARSIDKMNELAASLTNRYGCKVIAIAKDLSLHDSPAEIFSRLQQENIRVDILVNNAGFGEYGLFTETRWNKEAQMIDLNIRALTELTKLFLPSMTGNKYGRIMNVASTASFQPGPLMAVYFATKAYVLSFSEAIANELQGTGVTVTALCPGPTESGFKKAASLEDSKLFNEKKVPSSLEVAEYGYKEMMKGSTVAVHGIKNRIMAASVRFTPRRLVTAVVRMMNDEGKKDS